MLQRSSYVVLLERDGERRYTNLNTESEVCNYILSLYEQERMKKSEQEPKGKAAAEVFQYTANDVLDFLDLNMTDVRVLLHVPTAARVDIKSRPLYEAYDIEWVKAAVCRHLVGQLQDDDDSES